MDYLDAILNLVVVGLWLLWSSGRTPDSVARSRTTSHLYLGALVAVVVVRALFYWQIGSAINWVFQLTLGPTSIAFRSHDLALMFFFSILGALRVIVVFLVVTLAIGVLGAPVPIREQPGLIWMSVCPLRPGGRGWVAGVVSLLLIGAMWPPVWWLLRWKELVPAAQVFRVFLQAALVGVGALQIWLWTYIALVGVALINRHVYLGRNPYWNWLGTVGANALSWVRWMPGRRGTKDLRPYVALVLTVALAYGLRLGLGWAMIESYGPGR